MLLPRMNGLPQYLIAVAPDRDKIVTMLEFSLRTKSPLAISYENRNHEKTAKEIIVNTLDNNRFSAQVFADKKENGEESTTKVVKNFNISNVKKIQVLRYPATQ